MKILIIWIATIIYPIYGTICGYGLDTKGNPTETDKEPWLVGDLIGCTFYSNSPVCCTAS